MNTLAQHQPRTQPNPWLALAGFLAVTWIAPLLAAFSMPDDWFRSLAKPAWNPPDWLFGPVWSVLYTLMAIAAWRVWRSGPWSAVKTALILYGIQLGLNALWSPLFFSFHRPGLAFIDIVLLLLAIIATTVAFLRHDRVAAMCFAPYLAWVSFASVLNFEIWRLNS